MASPIACLPNSFSNPSLQALVKPSESDVQLVVRLQDGSALQLPASGCHLQNERDDTLDDLVRSDFLHEPG